MKTIRAFLPLIMLLGWAPLLQAQGSFDLAIGFGSVRDKATGLGIESERCKAHVPRTSPRVSALISSITSLIHPEVACSSRRGGCARITACATQAECSPQSV